MPEVPRHRLAGQNQERLTAALRQPVEDRRRQGHAGFQADGPLIKDHRHFMTLGSFAFSHHQSAGAGGGPPVDGPGMIAGAVRPQVGEVLAVGAADPAPGRDMNRQAFPGPTAQATSGGQDEDFDRIPRRPTGLHQTERQAGNQD